MSGKEKFEGFKENLIKENEEKYGKEVRKKYGDDVINSSNEKIKNITEEQYNEAEAISKEMMENLKKAYELKDYTCEEAQKAVELHKKWLCIFYPRYSKEYHLGLAEMYVSNERFRKNYDVIGEKGTEFFRNSIKYYLSK